MRNQKKKREKKQAFAQSIEVEKLVNQIRALKQEIAKCKEPLKLKIEQLEVQLSEAKKDVKSLELRMSTKISQLDYAQLLVKGFKETIDKIVKLIPEEAMAKIKASLTEEERDTHFPRSSILDKTNSKQKGSS